MRDQNSGLRAAAVGRLRLSRPARHVALGIASALMIGSFPPAQAQTVGFSFYPGAPYSPYGSPYGGYPSPYGSPYNNPALNQLTNQPSNQPTQPGQTQIPASQQLLQNPGNGSGGNSGGGGGGGNAASGGGGAASAPSGGSDDASHAILQDPNSPLYRRYEQKSDVTTPLRPQILAQVARGNGIRRGFIDESSRIRASLEGPGAAALDAHYDFAGQMIGLHLLPPVIGEVHDVKERANDKFLYLTFGAFQIVSPARLVLNAPTWRDYLFVNVADPQTSLPALQPQNSEEQSTYDQAYGAGVAKGILEARDTFEDNLNRLDRDYRGMQRYHELAKQGAVSLPVLADAKTAVRLADGGRRAFVGEQVVTLQVSPRFRAAHPKAYR